MKQINKILERFDEEFDIVYSENNGAYTTIPEQIKSFIKKEIENLLEEIVPEEKLHIILAGVLMNGYLQGQQNKKLDSSVVNQAIKDIRDKIK